MVALGRQGGEEQWWRWIGEKQISKAVREKRHGWNGGEIREVVEGVDLI
jgi:hypothetical protein